MLEAHGIVTRNFYEQHPPRAEYVLTEKGRTLDPVVQAMRDWGNLHEDADTEYRTSAVG
jgi:DNA-binding HxlR family transcriptional regulator